MVTRHSSCDVPRKLAITARFLTILDSEVDHSAVLAVSAAFRGQKRGTCERGSAARHPVLGYGRSTDSSFRRELLEVQVAKSDPRLQLLTRCGGGRTSDHRRRRGVLGTMRALYVKEGRETFR